MAISPAAGDRPERTDQALDAERRRVGTDRNRDQADTRVEPALGAEESLRLPNTNNRTVAGR